MGRAGEATCPGRPRATRRVATLAQLQVAVLVAVANAMAADAAGAPCDTVARDHGVRMAPARAGAQGDGARLALAFLEPTAGQSQATLVPMGLPARSAGGRPAVPITVDIMGPEQVGRA